MATSEILDSVSHIKRIAKNHGVSMKAAVRAASPEDPRQSRLPMAWRTGLGRRWRSEAHQHHCNNRGQVSLSACRVSSVSV